MEALMEKRERYSIRVAADPSDFARVMAVRSAVYLAEQRCPFDEEFDGNDYCAMHFIGFVAGEPAATARLRFFADFAKLERVAVMPRFRRSPIVLKLIEAILEVARRKGYRAIYGQIQKRLAGFWSKVGFEPLGKNRGPLVFSDHEYLEVICRLPIHPERITLDSDPLILIRPEGQWDHPGVLDRSALRPATNPH
jgi:predicted GNAT family N-acyltransferase